MSFSQPSISIITICFNIVNDIAETLESILNLKYDNVELIIIDGNSTDGTSEIIKRDYLPQLAQRSIETQYVCESDNGIYDAMNKGIRLAHGDWLIFMNGGDKFASEDVLNRVFSESISSNVDIIYGDTILKRFGVVMKPKGIDLLHDRMVFNHQSAFIRVSYHQAHPFDLQWRIVSDYDFFHKSYLQGATFQYLPIPIAIYDAEDGVSSRKQLKAEYERAQINGESRRLSWKIKYVSKSLVYHLKEGLKTLLPQQWVSSIREANYRRLAKRRKLK